MSNSTQTFDPIVQSQASKEITANAFFDAVSQASTYGRRASTCSGLTWGYYGGNTTITAGTLSQIANGTLTLTASTTCYIVALKSSGAVSFSTATTNWNDTTNYWRLYSVVTGTATVTSYTDSRELGKFSGADSKQPLVDVDNIRIDGNTISSTDTNGNITLAPNGTGDVVIAADTTTLGDSNVDATLTTSGTGDLIISTNVGTNSGTIRIYDGANGDINITPNGTGFVVTPQFKCTQFSAGSPVTKTTDTFTLGDTETNIICNNTATVTATLASAASFPGREIRIKTIAAFTVVSASSNVVPLDSATAGISILPATVGKWAQLVSDGTNWVIMQAN